MSEMEITNAVEDSIKLAFAQDHQISGTNTWKSPEFLQFREKQLEVLNKKFMQFLNEPGNDGDKFYDIQEKNAVYRHNVNKKFRQASGMDTSLWGTINNRFEVMSKEAKGQWLDGYGRLLNQESKMIRAISKPVEGLYSLSHMIESAGAGLTRYALSDNKKDLQDNPLKFVAKKIVALPIGLELAATGAVYKTLINPMYPIQGAKRWYKRRFVDEKNTDNREISSNRTLAWQKDNIKEVKTIANNEMHHNIDSAERGTTRGVAKTIQDLRVAKSGQHIETGGNSETNDKQSQLRARIAAMRGVSIGSAVPQERQVQVHSNLYHALETYARISAMEAISGASGISFDGMDKNKSLDVLKKASPEALKHTIGEFKADMGKSQIGNADAVNAVEKLPEQLGKQQNKGLGIENSMTPAAQNLKGIFDNVNQYKDANMYDSSENGQKIYEHKNKDFISDMQKILDIYKQNPNDAGVCDLLKNNLALLSQASVSASSHQEVDKMSEFMFQMGKELQTNQSVSSENKARIYEGLANMTNYEGDGGRHYNAFTNSSTYKNSLSELMEKADLQDKDMFYGKLSDKKLFEYNIHYEKTKPQQQANLSAMKYLKEAQRA